MLHCVNFVSLDNAKFVLTCNSTEHGAKKTFGGKNIALRQFAHQFDQEDSGADGVTPDIG